MSKHNLAEELGKINLLMEGMEGTDKENAVWGIGMASLPPELFSAHANFREAVAILRKRPGLIKEDYRELIIILSEAYNWLCVIDAELGKVSDEELNALNNVQLLGKDQNLQKIPNREECLRLYVEGTSLLMDVVKAEEEKLKTMFKELKEMFRQENCLNDSLRMLTANGFVQGVLRTGSPELHDDIQRTIACIKVISKKAGFFVCENMMEELKIMLSTLVLPSAQDIDDNFMLSTLQVEDYRLVVADIAQELDEGKTNEAITLLAELDELAISITAAALLDVLETDQLVDEYITKVTQLREAVL